MKNFWRAVRLALSQRWTLAGAITSSLVVALLWGANIGTIYPFIEVVFQGDSMHEWVAGKIAKSQAECDQFRQEVAKLEAAAVDAPPTERTQLARQVSIVRGRLDAETKALATYGRLEPFIVRYMPEGPFSTLLLVVAFLLVATIIKDALLMANTQLVGRLCHLTTFRLRKECYRRTLQLDLAAFGKDRTTQLMSRLTSDMGSLTAGLSTLLGRTVREPLKMLVCICGAAFISWRLLLLSLIVAPLAVFLTTRLARSIKRANRRAMEEMAQLYSRLAETFSGIQLVKACTMERHERNRFHETSKEYYRKVMRINFYGSLTAPNNELLGIGVICLALVAGCYLVLNQQTHLLGIKMTERPLTFGALMAFYAFLIGVSDPARKLSGVMSMLQGASAAADRVYAIHDREPTIVDPPSPKPLPSQNRELVLDHVSFHYEAGRPVLIDVDLTIDSGETIAIVGANGCGKTTLASLIPRFYDPVEGAVLLGGCDLRELRMRDLRREIGLVTQQTLLFDDTVANNIRYGRSGASESEIIEAAKKAHAHKFIVEQLTDGYQTQVGERGNRLSGGQRQRIALARAILRDPSILILDEATSQIDYESEQLIHKALEEFVRGRTTILITHRVHTLALARRILVMDEGRILDLGTHSELLSRCTVYQRLYQTSLRESA
jgi:ATP-binding cassette subfamily B protein/subfamily B ATP-binding cassette protein MsbA